VTATPCPIITRVTATSPTFLFSFLSTQDYCNQHKLKLTSLIFALDIVIAKNNKMIV